MDSQKIIGENLKKARKKRKLTQIELAELAGIDGNYYAQIERGEKNLSSKVLQKLSEALKVKSSEILPY